MKKLPIVVFISGNGSNLQRVIDECHGHSVDIRAVISDNRYAYGLQRAGQAGIPGLCIEQGIDELRKDYCDRLIEVVDNYMPRMILFLGFMKIVTPNFVQAYPNMIFNLHPSLLPDFPGTNTHQRVLEATAVGEVAMHGITIHMVDEGLDSGPIMFQRGFMINPRMTAENLERRVHDMEHEYVPIAVEILSQYIAATQGN